MTDTDPDSIAPVALTATSTRGPVETHPAATKARTLWKTIAGEVNSMGNLLAAGNGFTLTKETAAIFAAVIAGVASLIGAITAGILSFLNEKSRQRHANVTVRHGMLREHATRFTTTAIE